MSPKSAIGVCLTVSAIAFVLLVSLASAHTIRHDLGGDVWQYTFKALQTKARGEVVRIDGICGSACTAYLLNPNICATDRGVFIFHAASQPAGTRLLWANYPPRVRQRLGELTVDMVTFRALDVVRVC